MLIGKLIGAMRAKRAAVLIATAGVALLASVGVADGRPGNNPVGHKLAKPGTVVSAAPLKRRL